MTTYGELLERKTHSAYSRLVSVENFERSGISIYKLILTNQKGVRCIRESFTQQHLIVAETLSMMTYETTR